MKNLINITLMTLLLMFCSAAVSASAANTNIILVEAATINLDEAIEQVKKSKRGKILDAHTKQLDGRTVHVIKVLTKSGHVKKVRIKAISKD